MLTSIHRLPSSVARASRRAASTVVSTLRNFTTPYRAVTTGSGLVPPTPNRDRQGADRRSTTQ